MKQVIMLALLLSHFSSYSQTDTINSINQTLLTHKLKETFNTYLVYTEDSLHQKTSSGDIWERKTEFAKLNNQEVVKFTWNWYKNDSLVSVTTNICNKKTLAPLYHKMIYKNNWIVAYDFKSGYLIPSDSVHNNYVKDYPKRKLEIPVINWEQDLETFPLLPITKVGQKFSVSFFDVNEEKPSYHTYEVTDKTSLQLNENTNTTCWLLTNTHSESDYTTFWLSEQTFEVLKMEEYFGGNYRYKIKLF